MPIVPYIDATNTELAATYNCPRVWLDQINSRHGKWPLQILRTPETSLIYYNCRDFNAPTEGLQPFLIFDDVINYSDKLRTVPEYHPEFYILEQATPIAIVDLNKQSYSDWVDKLGVKPTYKQGAKFQQLTIEYFFLDPQQKLLPQKLLASLTRKQTQYPDFDGIGLHIIRNLLGNVTQDVMIEICDNELGWLATCLCFLTPTTLYMPYIDVSTDEILRKKQRGYVIGHMLAVKLAVEHNLKYVNFGLFFPYKSILACDCFYHPGLRYHNPLPVPEDYVGNVKQNG